MNMPAGEGPFPALVLAHGYIDPDAYVSGQGMPREQDRLARGGYVVLHTDYRNHAGSDKDPDNDVNLRLAYTEDVIGAALALRDSGRPERPCERAPADPARHRGRHRSPGLVTRGRRRVPEGGQGRRTPHRPRRGAHVRAEVGCLDGRHRGLPRPPPALSRSPPRHRFGPGTVGDLDERSSAGAQFSLRTRQ
jgi:hypothetical protein